MGIITFRLIFPSNQIFQMNISVFHKYRTNIYINVIPYFFLVYSPFPKRQFLRLFGLFILQPLYYCLFFSKMKLQI